MDKISVQGKSVRIIKVKDEDLKQSERLKMLNKIAISQMKLLSEDSVSKSFKFGKKTNNLIV